jgi:hypothetical protein
MDFKLVTKEMFFDVPAVANAMDKASKSVLSKFGAFVRRTAKGLIRRRKKISEPGQPPTNRTGFLRDMIVFGYDRDALSTVIGPLPLNGETGAPLLEYGGTAMRYIGGKRQLCNYKARPFMDPAFQRELPKLPDMWANAVK